MSYTSQFTMDMAHERRLDDLRIFPVTASDILPKKRFEQLVQGADQYPLAKATLERHDRALRRQSLNL